jgi:hypothetical protein
MTREKPAIPSHDYGSALKNAVNWLGDRYLLAEPVRRRNDEFKQYFVEPKNWLNSARRVTG